MIQAFFPVLRLAYWYFTAYAVLFCFIPFLNPADVYKRQEVGLLGVWMTCNYGAVLTSFALYRLLEQMGKSVSLIDFSFTERQNCLLYTSRCV